MKEQGCAACDHGCPECDALGEEWFVRDGQDLKPFVAFDTEPEESKPLSAPPQSKVTASEFPKVRCLHVDAGKPCTRYLEGSMAERAQIVEWLRYTAEAARRSNTYNAATMAEAYVVQANLIEAGCHARGVK